jgi:hypothetical protein
LIFNFVKKFQGILCILLLVFLAVERRAFLGIFNRIRTQMSTWKSKRGLHLVLFLASSFCLGGCVNLKAVHDFSTASVAGLKNFEEIDYTFLDHCMDRCEEEAISKFEIQRSLECPCDLYIKADSVTQLMFQQITGYFEALGALAQPGLTTYNTGAFVSSLTAEQMGPIKIDDNLAASYTALSNILLSATSGTVRKSKLAAYIEEANQPLQVVLEAIQGIIHTNLKGELRFKKERLYGFYMDMKMKNTLLSDYERARAATEYYQALREIQQKEKQMDLFVAALAKIAAGHQTLYDNRNKLTVNDLALSMLSYSAQVETLVSEFNKLKH